MSSESSKQKQQVEAFKKAARELGCDEDEAAFDKALRKIASEKPPASVQKRKRAASKRTGK
jgi:hypothetical protein